MTKRDYRALAAELFGPSVECIEGVLLKSGAAMLEQMHVELSSRDAEIERLRGVLGKVIAWLPAELGQAAQKELLNELQPPNAAIPEPTVDGTTCSKER